MSHIFPWKFNIYLAGIIFHLVLTWMEAECIGGAKEVKSLHRMLLDGYDPSVRPSQNYSNPTVITIQLHIQQVLGLDAGKQLIFMRAFVKIKWTDEYLQWDPKNFSDLDRTQMPQNTVWKPSLIIYSANEHHTLGSEETFVTVSSEGLVSWNPSFFLESSCLLDMTKYPYDVNVCNAIIYSIDFDNNTITFTYPEEPVVLKYMVVNGEFDITPANVSKFVLEYDDGNFEGLAFKIRLVRQPLYIITSVLVPLHLLAILSVFVFILPPEESAKVEISMTVLLAFTVFLDIIYTQISHKSDKICLLVVYTSALLILSFLSVMGNMLVIALRDWDQVTDKETVKSHPIDNNVQSGFTSDNIYSTRAAQDLPETDNMSSSSSNLTKSLITKIQKRRKLFHRIRAAKLNKVFFIVACILYILISVIIETLWQI